MEVPFINYPFSFINCSTKHGLKPETLVSSCMGEALLQRFFVRNKCRIPIRQLWQGYGRGRTRRSKQKPREEISDSPNVPWNQVFRHNSRVVQRKVKSHLFECLVLLGADCVRAGGVTTAITNCFIEKQKSSLWLKALKTNRLQLIEGCYASSLLEQTFWKY